MRFQLVHLLCLFAFADGDLGNKGMAWYSTKGCRLIDMFMIIDRWLFDVSRSIELCLILLFAAIMSCNPIVRQVTMCEKDRVLCTWRFCIQEDSKGRMMAVRNCRRHLNDVVIAGKQICIKLKCHIELVCHRSSCICVATRASTPIFASCPIPNRHHWYVHLFHRIVSH